MVVFILLASAFGASAVVTPPATAKKPNVKLQKTKSRSVTGAIKITAVPRGRPKAVTFLIDGRSRYVARKAPFRFGGADGRFDPASLSAGKHRITVRATFKRGRVAKASTVFRVRKRRRADQTIVSTVTRLPAAAASPSTASAVRPLPVWDGSADLGFGSWAEVQRIGGGSVAEIVDSPVLAGHKAFRFVIDGGERAELLAYQPQNRFGEGAEWWFGDVLFVPSQPNKSVGWEDSSHHTLMQWKNDGTGSPPFELDRRQNGLLLKINTAGEEVLLVPEAQLYDRPIAIEVRAKFSSSAAVGELEVWVNGQLKVPTVKAATLFAGRYSYFKQGQYGVGRGNVVYWQGAKRGTTRPSVQR